MKKFGKHRVKRGGIVLASKLIGHTLQEARKSGLPVLRFFSNNQVGENFGERLCNAIEQGFAHGFDRLIVCGTDTPSLHSRHFQDAAERLNTKSIVLGPSADGGVYLIGLRKEAFCRNAFLQISWLTGAVFSQLKQYAFRQKFSGSILPSEKDMDNADGLLQQQTLQCTWFSLFLRQLFSSLCVRLYASIIVPYIPSPVLQIFSLRGPPVFPSL